MKNVLWDILLIVVGVVLILFPSATMEIGLKIIGLVLLVSGAVGVILAVRGQGAYKVYTATGAALSVAAGVVCLVQPGIVVSILPLVMGIVILATGILNIGNAFSAKKAGAPKWGISLIIALITVVVGGIILLKLGDTAELMLRIIGVIFVFNGVSLLVLKVINRV